MRVRQTVSEAGCFLLLTIIGLLFAAQHSYCQTCTKGDVRLEGGGFKVRYQGRVEICEEMDNSSILQWKTVCSYGWDVNEATVVCKELGFLGTPNPFPISDGTFASSSTAISTKTFSCYGNELQLINCNFTENPIYCTSDQHPAGVYCFGNEHVQNPCPAGSTRLVNGYNNESGRVEFCQNGLWGTVCDDGWDSNDATTVCEELGYNYGARGIPTRDAYFGEGNGPIHLSNAECTNQHATLLSCGFDNSGVNGCTHSQDAGVICLGESSCNDGDVRLMNGSSDREGRVEICYNRVWGTLCDHDWDEVGASVVCRQLGFTNQPGSEANTTNNSRFGMGQSLILFEDVECDKNYSRLSQCLNLESIGLSGNCDPSKHTAGVMCMAVDSQPTEITTTNDNRPTTEADTPTMKENHLTTDSETNRPTTETNQPTAETDQPTQPPIEQRGSTTGSNQSPARASKLTAPIVGTVGALVVLGAIMVVAIVLLILLIRRGRVKKVKLSVLADGNQPMDNPIYAVAGTPCTTTNTSSSDEERVFQNCLYSAVENNSSETIDPYRTYDEAALVSHYTAPTTQNGGKIQTNKNGVGSNLDDPNVYSQLDQAQYHTLEPHIPQQRTEQLPSPDEYSQLQH